MVNFVLKNHREQPAGLVGHRLTLGVQALHHDMFPALDFAEDTGDRETAFGADRSTFVIHEDRPPRPPR